MSCQCSTCVRLWEYRDKGIPDEIIDYIFSLEQDIEYYQAIFSAEWPSGKERLLEALKHYE